MQITEAGWAALFDGLRGVWKPMPADGIAPMKHIVSRAYSMGLLRNQVAYVIATALWETAYKMQPVRENLNYTSAARIRAVWPSRFKSNAAAQPFVRNPQGLANEVYNGRMGNRSGSNDGWNFRGRGFVQITGRDAYARASRELGVDLVANPDRALDLNVATDCLLIGMRDGWYRPPHTLAKHLTLQRSNWTAARNIINADVKANGGKIGKIAAAADRALRAMEAANGKPLKPTPKPKPVPVPTLPHATIVHRLGARPLQFGDQGADVAEWQNLLNELGYKLTVDTHFGEATRAATRDRQRHAGRSETGVVDLELIADTRRVVAERKAAVASAKDEAKGGGKGAAIGGAIGVGGTAYAVDQGITTIDRIKNMFSPEVGGAVVMVLILAIGALALWWFVIKPRRGTKPEPTPREVREVDAAAGIFRARQVYAAPVYVEPPVETEPYDDEAEAA